MLIVIETNFDFFVITIMYFWLPIVLIHIRKLFKKNCVQH